MGAGSLSWSLSWSLSRSLSRATQVDSAAQAIAKSVVPGLFGGGAEVGLTGHGFLGVDLFLG